MGFIGNVKALDALSSIRFEERSKFAEHPKHRDPVLEFLSSSVYSSLRFVNSFASVCSLVCASAYVFVGSLEVCTKFVIESQKYK